MSSLVKLNINNREYPIECGLGQEDDTIRLSYELDRRIKNNAAVLGDNNPSLLFVITALQILDELEDARTGGGQININEEIGKATVTTLSQISERIENIAQSLTKKAG